VPAGRTGQGQAVSRDVGVEAVTAERMQTGEYFRVGVALVTESTAKELTLKLMH